MSLLVPEGVAELEGLPVRRHEGVVQGFGGILSVKAAHLMLRLCLVELNAFRFFLGSVVTTATEFTGQEYIQVCNYL